MQKISDVISKPVFSLYEGINVGTVKNFFFDERTKKIKGFFIFDDETDGHENFLPAEKIYSVAESCLIIKNASVLAFSKENLLEQDKIIYSQALSINGDCFGKISDVFFDEKFNVTSFETSSLVVIPIQHFARLGKDAIFFDVEKKVNIAKLKPKDSKISFSSLPEIKVSILNEDEIGKGFPIISKNFDEKSFVEERKIESNVNEKKKTEITFPKKLSTVNSLLGKRSNKTIIGLNGEVVVKDFQIITEKIIEKAKKHSKLVELTNSVL